MTRCFTGPARSPRESGAWSTRRETPIESNSHPRVVFADQPWVAYQIQNVKTRSIGAQIIDDDPEPFRSIIATTGFTGNLDIQLNSEASHLWVTWIDSGSNVGFAEFSFDKNEWSVPVMEPFVSDSAAAARARIRERVLAP